MDRQARRSGTGVMSVKVAPASGSTRSVEDRLDAALADSFPASDPVAIAIDHGKSARKPSATVEPKRESDNGAS